MTAEIEKDTNILNRKIISIISIAISCFAIGFNIRGIFETKKVR